MKYLITVEDGCCYSADSITDSEINASSLGVLLIVNVQDETIHIDGDEWSPIDKWENQ